MRVAICYHGIAKGHNYKNGGLPVGFEYEFELFKKNLIAQNKGIDFDIYLHSWSIKYKDSINNLLNPVNSLFETPKFFKKPSIKILIKENIKKLLGKGFELQRINNIYSRWYSFHKVCELVNKSNKKYDLVIVTRFDMCLLKPFNISSLNKENFYSGDWITYTENNKEILEENFKNVKLDEIKKGYPYDNEGLQDFFFIANHNYMIENFSNIYFELKGLIKKYGPSNHLIALGKLKKDNMINMHKRILVYSKDYFLSRWL